MHTEHNSQTEATQGKCVLTWVEVGIYKSRVGGAILQSKGKERIICLTAERRTKRRGFKGSLHVCKAVSGTLQVLWHCVAELVLLLIRLRPTTCLTRDTGV